MPSDQKPEAVVELLDQPRLAATLASDHFKQFLDRVPVAVAVAALQPTEHIIYVNREFERLSGQAIAELLGGDWNAVLGHVVSPQGSQTLHQSIERGPGHLGCFDAPRGDDQLSVDAWASVIDDDAGAPTFRLVALAVAPPRNPSILEALEEKVREKDVQLQELQHRVRNNLQMITSLIRVEARGVTDLSTGEGFDRLAGRVEALGLLYRALGDDRRDKIVDLGIYLGEIATAVMRAHAVEGIHLDLQVDTWLVSIDVAMPTGLVVNELLTNALKHAFQGRSRGAITLHSTVQPGDGCHILVADNGVGLPDGYTWPKPGKLSALIVHSLLQNAAAEMNVTSVRGEGMRVEITFDKGNAVRGA